jgi:mannosyltransferase
MLKFAEITVLETNSRYQYGLLAAITLLVAALSFYKLGVSSFWIDEISTIGQGQAHYNDLESIIRNIPPTRNWIPISSILTGQVLNGLGTSEWSARSVPAIIGVISIPALYYPIKRLFSPGVGLVTVLMLTVSPWHLYWSQNARFYTSLMLFFSPALLASSVLVLLIADTAVGHLMYYQINHGNRFDCSNRASSD